MMQQFQQRGCEVKVRLEGAHVERMGKCVMRRHGDNYEHHLTNLTGRNIPKN
jgi:hypothetical protein